MKQQLIDKYFKAWETKDMSLMNEVLTPNNFGIRTFLKNVYYTKDSLQKELSNSLISKYKMNEVNTKMNTAIVSATIQTDIDTDVLIKFTFIDGTIRKVYEVPNDPKINRIRCHVTYDGSRFNGFQKQPNGNTIQGTIEKALNSLTKDEITIHASGRTDKGVHAVDQVFHFDTRSTMKPIGFYQLLNKYLPNAIRIKSCEEVDLTFHSRFDVKTKEYMYLFNLEKDDIFHQNYEWNPNKFDLDIFNSQLQSVIGTHNFASFTKTNPNITYVRTIYKAYAIMENGKMKLFIKGSGFLRYMVRNIVAALVLIASGEANFTIDSLIRDQDNSILQELAPSGGLYLHEVTYYE